MKIKQFSLKHIFYLFIASLLMVGCSSDDDSPEPPNEEASIEDSLFEDDAEGWTIVGDAQGGYIEASYSEEGGVIEGYIYADDDVAGGVWYFSAPDDYLGDKNEYYGATLNYSLFQNSAMSDQFESEDIIFKSDEKQIFYLISEYPTSDWTPYSIEIMDNGQWYYGSFDENTIATEAQIKDVLSNVTEFWIRGEFESGSDDGGLDKVEIIEN
ncbi:hypothetical protein CAP47_07300 [Psychroflexus sp. S27]|uniref:laminin B domain-containing protein n=1 Tax=Psychroflexus sp. S27 TaxID=1982757 RepID=UPI000C2B35EA|nr:laminin B domain-containing protein [Psychroflexus sp. S27]PJX22822.1 hypothetical protein CAP47_07300 [Psychroflexus sp. S27]